MTVKEGDIFKWYYKDDAEYRARSPNGTAYWCLDNQCVAIERNGEIRLVDTYWNGPDPKLFRISDSTHFVDPEKVDLEFICNTNDVIGLHSWEVEDYDVVYNLSWQKDCHKEYATDAEAYKRGPSNTAVLKKYVKEYNDLLSQKEYIEGRLLSLSDSIDELEDKE